MANDYCERCGVSLGLQDLHRPVMLCERCKAEIKAENTARRQKEANEPDLLDDIFDLYNARKNKKAAKAAAEKERMEEYSRKVQIEAENEAHALGFSDSSERYSKKREVEKQLGQSYSEDFCKRFIAYCKKDSKNSTVMLLVLITVFLLFGYVGRKYFGVYAMILFAFTGGLIVSGIRQIIALKLYDKYGIFKFHGDIDLYKYGPISGNAKSMALVFRIDPKSYILCNSFIGFLICDLITFGYGFSRPILGGFIGICIAIVLSVLLNKHVSKKANRTSEDIVKLGFDQEFDVDLNKMNSLNANDLNKLKNKIKSKSNSVETLFMSESMKKSKKWVYYSEEERQLKVEFYKKKRFLWIFYLIGIIVGIVASIYGAKLYGIGTFLLFGHVATIPIYLIGHRISSHLFTKYKINFMDEIPYTIKDGKVVDITTVYSLDIRSGFLMAISYMLPVIILGVSCVIGKAVGHFWIFTIITICVLSFLIGEGFLDIFDCRYKQFKYLRKKEPGKYEFPE